MKTCNTKQIKASEHQDFGEQQIYKLQYSGVFTWNSTVILCEKNNQVLH